MPNTKSIRTTDTIQFFPHNCTIPQINANDCFVLAVQDLTSILTEKSPFPFMESQSTKATLNALRKALKYPDTVARVKPTKKQQQRLPIIVPRVPNVPNKQKQMHTVPRVPTRNRPVTRNKTRTIHKIGTIVRKRFNRDYYEGEVIGYNDNNGYYKIKYRDGDEEEYDANDMKKYYKQLQKYSPKPTTHTALATHGRYDTNFNYKLFPAIKLHRALAAGGTIWDPELQTMAHYRDFIIHPNPMIKRRWIQGGENEFGRLFNGYGKVEGMKVCEWVDWVTIPHDKVITYARYTVAYRPEKIDEPWRVRITAGGDRLRYEGPVSTQVAGMETFKILLNSTISTEGAKLVTGDISNMYSESFLKEAECVRFKVDQIPENIIKHYKLDSKIRNGFVYAKINRAWYGLKQSGKIAHDDLVEHLKKEGYTKTTTEGLFKHCTRDITFTLVVDNFAIKYTNKADAEDLITCIRKKYKKFKVDWEAKQYIGINLKWDHTQRTVKLSMDGYSYDKRVS